MSIIPGRVKKGDPLRIGAETWNQILQVVRDNQPGSGSSARGFRYAPQASPPHPFQIVPKSGLSADVLMGHVYVFDFLGDNGFGIGQTRVPQSASNLTLFDDATNYIYVRVNMSKVQFTSQSVGTETATLSIWRVTSNSSGNLGIIVSNTEEFNTTQYDGTNGTDYYLIGTVDTAGGEIVPNGIEQVIKENFPIMPSTITFFD